LRLRLQRFIPPSLKFCGNQPVLRINRIVLPTCSRSFIPRLFKRQLLVPHAFVLLCSCTFNGLE